MTSERKTVQETGILAALIGSVIQFVVGTAILFLPIIPSNDSESLHFMSLISLYRPNTIWLGYVLTFIEFILVVLPGILVISAIRQNKIGPLRLYCLLDG